MPTKHKLPERGSRDRPGTVIAPSILNGDFARLADECKKLLELGSDWLHLDCMDGHFVPNFTIGAPIVASLRKHTDAFLDCHLMVSNPRQWVQDFAKAGADMYTFHVEAVVPDTGSLSHTAMDSRMVEMCKAVRDAGMYVGVALKPKTSAELAFPYVDAGLVDMVLVMTVEPGFGGQKYMDDAAAKCRVLRQRYPDLQIQVDGGISPSTVAQAAGHGANVLVAGSAIVNAADPGAVINMLKGAVDTAATAAGSA